jgi:hypothetical protein
VAVACLFSGAGAQALTMSDQLHACTGQVSIVEPTPEAPSQQALVSCDGQFTLANGVLTSDLPVLIEGVASLRLQQVRISAPAITLRSAGEINVGADTQLDAGQVNFETVGGASNATLTVAPGVTIAGQSSGYEVRTQSPEASTIAVPKLDVRTGGTISLGLAGGVAVPIVAVAASEAASGAVVSATTTEAATTPAPDDAKGGGGAVDAWGLLALAGLLASTGFNRRR